MASKRRFVKGEDGWTTVRRIPLPPRHRKPPSRPKTHRPRPQKIPKIFSLFPTPKPTVPSLPNPKTTTQFKPVATNSFKLTPFSQHQISFKKALAAPTPTEPTMSLNRSDERQPPTGLNRMKGLRIDDSTELPVPPDPSKREWKNRCFKCLSKGHSKPFCKQKVWTCPRCRVPGHDYTQCPRDAGAQGVLGSDPLVPKGNLGDEGLPVNRPDSISAVIPLTPDSVRELHALTSAVVIDARLKPHNHSTEKIQAIIMAAVNTDVPYKLLHMSDDRYVYILPPGINRDTYLTEHSDYFRRLGYVVYQWSPAIDAVPVQYRYKVWIDLLKVPLNAWNDQHIQPLASQIGLLLHHSSFDRSTSIDILRIVVAVEDLSKIPKSAFLTIKAIRKPIALKVVGWIEDDRPIRVPTDPTPPLELFTNLEKELQQSPIQAPWGDDPKNLVPLDFGVMYDFWKSLDPSLEKDCLCSMLQQTPYWMVYQKRDLLSTMNNANLAQDQPLQQATEDLRVSSSTAPDSTRSLFPDPLADAHMSLQLPQQTYTGTDLVARAQALDITAAKARHLLLSKNSTGQQDPHSSPIPPQAYQQSNETELHAAQQVPSLAIQHPPAAVAGPSVKRATPNSDVVDTHLLQGNLPSPNSLDSLLVDIPVSVVSSHACLPTAHSIEVQVVNSVDSDQVTNWTVMKTKNISVLKHSKVSVAEKKKAKVTDTSPPPPPPAVRKRITKANLERLLQDEEVLNAPLSVEERQRGRQACGMIQLNPVDPSDDVTAIDLGLENDRLSDYWADLSADDEVDDLEAN